MPPQRLVKLYRYKFLPKTDSVVQYSLSDVDIRHKYVSFSLVYCFIRLKISSNQSFVSESRSCLACNEYLLECQTIGGHSSNALTVEL